ncbi:hypothetical protein [Paenibacillus piri]|uniref:Uncharacterized protein n=1 Tax=Paenibacillus piri TaxID=2547395 RepID=A0A4R5KQT7_9BACL|nr:hypothetical protein [Paenibacillus piri]TDF97127.1 hypothetical protein E1757_14920 [Paenibacillus piri]
MKSRQTYNPRKQARKAKDASARPEARKSKVQAEEDNNSTVKTAGPDAGGGALLRRRFADGIIGKYGFARSDYLGRLSLTFREREAARAGVRGNRDTEWRSIVARLQQQLDQLQRSGAQHTVTYRETVHRLERWIRQYGGEPEERMRPRYRAEAAYMEAGSHGTLAQRKQLNETTADSVLPGQTIKPVQGRRILSQDQEPERAYEQRSIHGELQPQGPMQEPAQQKQRGYGEDRTSEQPQPEKRRGRPRKQPQSEEPVQRQARGPEQGQAWSQEQAQIRNQQDQNLDRDQGSVPRQKRVQDHERDHQQGSPAQAQEQGQKQGRGRKRESEQARGAENNRRPMQSQMPDKAPVNEQAKEIKVKDVNDERVKGILRWPLNPEDGRPMVRHRSGQLSPGGQTTAETALVHAGIKSARGGIAAGVLRWESSRVDDSGQDTSVRFATGRINWRPVPSSFPNNNRLPALRRRTADGDEMSQLAGEALNDSGQSAVGRRPTALIKHQHRAGKVGINQQPWEESRAFRGGPLSGQHGLIPSNRLAYSKLGIARLPDRDGRVGKRSLSNRRSKDGAYGGQAAILEQRPMFTGLRKPAVVGADWQIRRQHGNEPGQPGNRARRLAYNGSGAKEEQNRSGMLDPNDGIVPKRHEPLLSGTYRDLWIERRTEARRRTTFRGNQAYFGMKAAPGMRAAQAAEAVRPRIPQGTEGSGLIQRNAAGAERPTDNDPTRALYMAVIGESSGSSAGSPTAYRLADDAAVLRLPKRGGTSPGAGLLRLLSEEGVAPAGSGLALMLHRTWQHDAASANRPQSMLRPDEGGSGANAAGDGIVRRRKAAGRRETQPRWDEGLHKRQAAAQRPQPLARAEQALLRRLPAGLPAMERSRFAAERISAGTALQRAGHRAGPAVQRSASAAGFERPAAGAASLVRRTAPSAEAGRYGLHGDGASFNPASALRDWNRQSARSIKTAADASEPLRRQRPTSPMAGSNLTAFGWAGRTSPISEKAPYPMSFGNAARIVQRFIGQPAPLYTGSVFRTSVLMEGSQAQQRDVWFADRPGASRASAGVEPTGSIAAAQIMINRAALSDNRPSFAGSRFAGSTSATWRDTGGRPVSRSVELSANGLGSLISRSAALPAIRTTNGPLSVSGRRASAASDAGGDAAALSAARQSVGPGSKSPITGTFGGGGRMANVTSRAGYDIGGLNVPTSAIILPKRLGWTREQLGSNGAALRTLSRVARAALPEVSQRALGVTLTGASPRARLLRSPPAIAHRNEALPVATPTAAAHQQQPTSPSSVLRRSGQSAAPAAMTRQAQPQSSPSSVLRRSDQSAAPAAMTRQVQPQSSPSSVLRRSGQSAPAAMTRQAQPQSSPSSVLRRSDQSAAPAAMARQAQQPTSPLSVLRRSEQSAAPAAMARQAQQPTSPSSVLRRSNQSAAPSAMARQAQQPTSPSSVLRRSEQSAAPSITRQAQQLPASSAALQRTQRLASTPMDSPLAGTLVQKGRALYGGGNIALRRNDGLAKTPGHIAAMPVLTASVTGSTTPLSRKPMVLQAAGTGEAGPGGRTGLRAALHWQAEQARMDRLRQSAAGAAAAPALPLQRSATGSPLRLTAASLAPAAGSTIAARTAGRAAPVAAERAASLLAAGSASRQPAEGPLDPGPGLLQRQAAQPSPLLEHKLLPEAGRDGYEDETLSPSMDVLRTHRTPEERLAQPQSMTEQPIQPNELSKEQIKELIKQIPQLDVNKIADKVARELERRMRFERQRRGM